MDKISLLSIVALSVALPGIRNCTANLDIHYRTLRNRFIVASALYAAYVMYVRPRIGLF